MIKAVIFDMFETLITHYDSPLYFGAQIAHDSGIPTEVFRKPWRAAEAERSTGKTTLEELLKRILTENGRYSPKLLETIIEKRIRAKEEAFDHLDSEIIPMLEALKEKGILIALISNCYDEEAYVIRKSRLYPYFDAVCLSYEEKVIKPDRAIFERCLEKLGVKAQECLYVGDGGSDELETARNLGMKAIQAAWYLKKHDYVPTEAKNNFTQVFSPLEIMKFI